MAARLMSFLTLVTLLACVGCGGEQPKEPVTQAKPQELHQTSATSSSVTEAIELVPGGSFGESPAKAQPVADDPIVEVVTSAGKFRMRLFADKAPNTVANFLDNYVLRHAYDNTIVHFCDSEFMIAMGGFDSEYQPIPARDAILSEADNGLQNKAGTVAMAHIPDYVHSATSQFFINVVDNDFLDYQEREDGALNGYCVFGKVIEGMEVVQKIAAAPTGDRADFANTPIPPIIVRSVRLVGSVKGDE